MFFFLISKFYSRVNSQTIAIELIKQFQNCLQGRKQQYTIGEPENCNWLGWRRRTMKFLIRLITKDVETAWKIPNARIQTDFRYSVNFFLSNACQSTVFLFSSLKRPTTDSCVPAKSIKEIKWTRKFMHNFTINQQWHLFTFSFLACLLPHRDKDSTFFLCLSVERWENHETTFYDKSLWMEQIRVI